MQHISSILLLLLLLGAGCKSAPQKKTKNFRIATYNVWVGYHDGKHPRLPCDPSGKARKEGISNWLTGQDLDVVAFQELMNYTDDSLRKEAAQWGHSYALVHRDKGMAMGITSRYPIEVKEILGTESMHHGLIYCRIAGIDIVATHLWPSFDETILDEANKVAQRVERSMSEKRPVIVLGDLNAFSPQDDALVSDETMELYKNQWKWELENGRPSYRVMQRLLALGLEDVCIPFSKNDEARKQRYDYILASPELAKQCVDATHYQDAQYLKWSDHFPVIAEFKWP